MKKIITVTVSLAIVVVLTAAVFVNIVIPDQKEKTLKQELKQQVTELAEGLVIEEGSIELDIYNLEKYPEEFKQFYSLGYAAAPFMLDYVIENQLNNTKGMFLVEASAYNLEFPRKFSDLSDEKSNPAPKDIKYPAVFYAEEMKKRIISRLDSIKEVCDDEDAQLLLTYPSRDQINRGNFPAMSSYGFLCLPELAERYRNGEKDWLECPMVKYAQLDVDTRWEILQKTRENFYASTGYFSQHPYEAHKTSTANTEASSDYFRKYKTEINILKEYS